MLIQNDREELLSKFNLTDAKYFTWSCPLRCEGHPGRSGSSRYLFPLNLRQRDCLQRFIGENGEIKKDSHWQPMGTGCFHKFHRFRCCLNPAVCHSWWLVLSGSVSWQSEGCSFSSCSGTLVKWGLYHACEERNSNPKHTIAAEDCRQPVVGKYERTPGTQKHQEQWMWSSSKCLHPRAHLCNFPQFYQLSLKFQVRSHHWFINIQLDALGDSMNKQTGNITVYLPQGN